ncbi:MAG: excalibur calcium-binding domain-containing protein [Nocardioidaceae bacterium]
MAVRTRVHVLGGSGIILGSTALLVLIGCAPAMAPPLTSTPSGDAPTTDAPSPRPSQQHSVTPLPSAPRPRPTRTTRAASPALVALASLTVKGRAAMSGYSRDLFGEPWTDVDGNGCDTRDDILGRDVSDARMQSGSDCVVESGRLEDPYLGHPIPFQRGYDDLVDIDHVVALGNAWATGAFRWDASKRLALANDPAGLLAVDASSNRQKGDGDAATWLPHNKAFRCGYVARQVSIKGAYGLWVTPPERAAIARVLSGCPGETLPPVRPLRHPTVAAAPRRPSSTSGTGGAGSVYYDNCDAARAAGAAPVHRGDPGYSSNLDRDGDGVGCE